MRGQMALKHTEEAKMENDRHINFYYCDPEKNVDCKKTSCYINGGLCCKTSHEEYKITDPEEEGEE